MVSSPCAIAKLFIIYVTMNELIGKIPWEFKDVCVYVSYECSVCDGTDDLFVKTRKDFMPLDYLNKSYL